MAKYVYKAKRGPGEVVEGAMEADAESIAVKQLIEKGLYPISVKWAAPLSKEKKDGILFLSRKVKTEVVANFTRQLSELLDSGLVLYDALNIVENQIESSSFKKVVRGIRENIRDGNTFSESLRLYPRIFSNLYVNLVKSGEAGSMLREALNNISDFLEKEEDIRSRITAALIYPGLMMAVGIVTIFILMGFVIPKLANMFIDMGELLPLPTRILIGFSDFIRSYWILLLIFAGGFISFPLKSRSNIAAKRMIDKFNLSLPVFVILIKHAELARFSRTLSTLLKNGVPILSALKISSNIVENEVLKAETVRVYSEVKEGSSLAAAVKKKTSFPQFIVNMATIGEEGGILDKTLLKVARTYEIESDRKIKILSALLEPVIILVMGIVVGFIVISMLLPVFQISLTVH